MNDQFAKGGPRGDRGGNAKGKAGGNAVGNSVGNSVGNLGGNVAPKRQKYWDWRAAGNFIGGGAGGSLLFFAALATLGGAAFAPLALLGLGLVAAGLTCVWLEIGRPWRALNVFRHPSSSWMTREASVAPFMFGFGLLALLFGGPALTWISAGLGLGFVYSQARILTADKGIPAWRHRRCVPLMVSTGLTEGAGLLALLSPWFMPGGVLMPGGVFASAGVPATGHGALVVLGILLLVLLALRVFLWRAYLDGLSRDGAPLGSLRVLRGLDGRFMSVGHALPALLLLTSFAPLPGAPWLLVVAGMLAVGAGWLLKYTLVRRAAYNQGFALPHQPVRGQVARQGTALPVRPGWGGVGGIGGGSAGV